MSHRISENFENFQFKIRKMNLKVKWLEKITPFCFPWFGLAAKGTKSLLVADCIEKLTVLSEVNQVTIMWVPGHSGIQQNETADRLAREGARTRPIGSEPFLLLSLNRFKSKIRNWIEKKKQTELEVCEKYGSSQLCLEGPTDRYVQFRDAQPIWSRHVLCPYVT